ncbi:CG42495 [Drosophila busckii]|uniref:CG42495 n=1 Tax=Drosophila busckii TaxID=30019 RepID=A0A0M5JBI2_DROBS|nr:CG42495 [Drosophila busckii]
MTQQTLTATVLTAASNYILSFILGALVYVEPLTALSGIGMTLILAGLWFLCEPTTSATTTVEQITPDKKKI